MLGVAGTVPHPGFPLTEGAVEISSDILRIDGLEVPVNRGTPALLAAAWAVAQVMGRQAPHAWLVGDQGLGHGSRSLYAHMESVLPSREMDVLAFHYLQPDADWHGRVLLAVQAMAEQPLLVADAGFQYVAKMCGEAPAYDLFFPDAGELAFLADEKAPHPFYTRGFLLADGHDVLEMAARAWEHGNAARRLLVKGLADHLLELDASSGEVQVLASVESPVVEALEAVGGTGDTLTGMTAALMEAGLDMTDAALAAMRANRLAGALSSASPATSIAHIIGYLPRALDQALAMS
ncbi:MAG: sugar kinase [Desulfovibrio sp.]|nr:MAG: sugar kinase [Desulfovibrio sp.]